MRILSISTNNNIKHNKKYMSYPKLRPLFYDTVTFGAMKKNQFQGVDLTIIDKFRAPIEKFDTRKDFYDWCEDEISDNKKKSYYSKNEGANIHRKYMLEEWKKYITQENNIHDKSIQLLILDGITKNLKEDNEEIPPVLNKRILADTILEIQQNLEKK